MTSIAGPYPQSTPTTGEGNNTTPTDDAPKWRRTGNWLWQAPERGAQGITAAEVKDTTDDDGTSTGYVRTGRVEHLPPIRGRFERGNGVCYLLGTTWGTTEAADAEDVQKGNAFARAGYPLLARELSGDRDLARVWHSVAAEWPVTGTSPTVLEGLPPLAPDLAPLTEDEAAARAAWAELGQMLAPTGRLIIGAALLSPWVSDKRIGITPGMIHVWGAAGAGKTLAARTAAALFGDPWDDAAGLFGTFDAAGQGIAAHAQTLSYLPVILDELQSSTGTPEAQITALVMGASRKRANRTGTAQRTGAKWAGLVLTTGNEPSRFQHEMWARRLIEVQAATMWQAVPEDGTAREAYWGRAAALLDAAAGHPWAAVRRTYTPGTADADRVRAAYHARPTLGAGNLGGILRLGGLGCEWLTAWTGADWTTGTAEAAAEVLAAAAEAAPDPARDAARALLDDMATNPVNWSASALSRDLTGTAATNVDAACALAHDHAPEACQWLHVVSSGMEQITGRATQSLGQTRFRQAVHTGPDGWLARSVRIGGRKVRAVTTCAEGLAVVAGMTGPAAAEAATPVAPPPLPPKPPTIPETTAAPAPLFTRHADAFTDAPAPAAVEAPAPAAEDAAGDGGPRRFVAEQSADVTTALDLAADAGATDVVLRFDRIPMKAVGWDHGGWKGKGDSRMFTRDRDGARVRVWLAPNSNTTPAAYVEALEAFTALPGQGAYAGRGPAIHGLIRDPAGRGRAGDPRWQVPAEQAELWTPETVLHPVGFGAKPEAGTAVQWDRNRSHLGAITQANLAPLHAGEAFEHYGADAPVDRQHGGMYLIRIPEWDHEMPAPHGNEPVGECKWTTPEIVRLYAELAEKYGTPTPEILEAWLAPVHRVAPLHRLAETVKQWMETPARPVAKTLYQSTAGVMMAEHARGARGRVYRPDWGQAIRDNSFANVLRQAYRTWEADNTWVPSHVNVDAIYYPAEKGNTVPPEMRIGDGLGQYKMEAGA